MIDTIHNSRYSVSVKRFGAEWCSLKGPDGAEYLWQADPAVWGRHAPVLFPIIGKLGDERYRLEGRTYGMKPHGFARDLDFELMGATDTMLEYGLDPSAVTLSQYPFTFRLTRRYELDDQGLGVSSRVVNTGASVMPFSIGEHPAFALNWRAGDRVEDYYLEFESPESPEATLLDARGLVSSQRVPVITDGRRLDLRRDLFDRDALIFLKLNSHSITLRSRHDPRRLVVEFKGYPDLGIWAKPGAAFVCIEPWYGHADPADHDGDMLNKPGLINLEPGAQFSCEWHVRVE